MPPPPDDDEANLVSSTSSNVSSATFPSISNFTTAPPPPPPPPPTESTKPPRSPNIDRKSFPPRARTQSTDSGTTCPKPSTTTTTTTSEAATTTLNSPPPLRQRCFSTDSGQSNKSSSMSTCSSSNSSFSPPPLAPGRRRSYSSDSEDQSRRSSLTRASSSRSLQHGQRRRESKSSRRGSTSTTNGKASGASTAVAGGPLDLQTLEMELQKNTLLHGKHHVSVGKLWNAIGNSHFRNGNHRAAIQAYKQAGSCDPGPHVATAYLNLGTVYWNLLKVDKAIKYLQQALAAFGCEQQTAAAPGSMATPQGDAASLDIASCHHQLGLAYSLQHRFDEAVCAMETACRMRATLLGTSDPRTARTLDALGRIHLMRGDYHQALVCHEQALYALRLANFPATPTLENIAAVHMRRGDFSAAIHVYVQVVYLHKSAWQASLSTTSSSSSAAAPRSNRGSAEQYYESLQQLASAYDRVGETTYADHCRQEAAEILEH